VRIKSDIRPSTRIESYSKYFEYPEFEQYISERIAGDWTEKVSEIKTRLLRGKEIAEQINILGDDGVPVEYHITFWKSEFIDFILLQQDSFDEIDAVTSLERQKNILDLVVDVCRTDFEFDNFNEVSAFFKELINIGRQMNYSEFGSERFNHYYNQLKEQVSANQLSAVSFQN